MLSVDAKRNEDGGYTVYSRNGTQATEWNPVDWAVEAQRLGAGENSIELDRRGWPHGGYDIPLIRSVSDAVDLPVVAVGGAGTTAHFAPVVLKGGAAAVAAGSIFHYTKITPNMVKKAMADCQIPVRLADSNVEYIIE